MSAGHRIVLATPHARYDALEAALRERHGFDVLRLRQRAELGPDTLAAFGPSHVFLPHWSWKIPEAVFAHHECVVFHMTDLPFGRGGSPLQNLVVRGIQQTKLSALRCGAEIDAGPIYLKRDLSTLGTAEEIFLRAALLMEEMIVAIAGGPVQPVEQVGEVVHFTRRTPEQGDLRQAASLADVHDLIRMLDASGYPQAFIEAGGLRFEFTRASAHHDHVLADVRISLANPKEPT
jgi:methionyl-tRNA formyltransferase